MKNEFNGMSLHEKLESRKDLLNDLVESVPGGKVEISTKNIKQLDSMLTFLERVQQVDDSIITELLQPRTTERERELEQIALSWQAESEKWRLALVGYQLQYKR